MDEAYNSAAAIYVGGAGGLGFVLGIRPLVPLPPYIAQIMLIVMLVGAALLMLVMLRERRGLVVALALTAVIGLAAFGLLYGAMRYFYNMSLNGSLFEFGAP